MGMEDIVGKYIKQLHEPNHRFKSWEHCFMAFSDFNNDVDYLTLQLASPSGLGVYQRNDY